MNIQVAPQRTGFMHFPNKSKGFDPDNISASVLGLYNRPQQSQPQSQSQSPSQSPSPPPSLNQNQNQNQTETTGDERLSQNSEIQNMFFPQENESAPSPQQQQQQQQQPSPHGFFHRSHDYPNTVDYNPQGLEHAVHHGFEISSSSAKPEDDFYKQTESFVHGDDQSQSSSSMQSPHSSLSSRSPNRNSSVLSPYGFQQNQGIRNQSPKSLKMKVESEVVQQGMRHQQHHQQQHRHQHYHHQQQQQQQLRHQHQHQHPQQQRLPPSIRGLEINPLPDKVDHSSLHGISPVPKHSRQRQQQSRRQQQPSSQSQSQPQPQTSSQSATTQKQTQSRARAARSRRSSQGQGQGQVQTYRKPGKNKASKSTNAVVPDLQQQQRSFNQGQRQMGQAMQQSAVNTGGEGSEDAIARRPENTCCDPKVLLDYAVKVALSAHNSDAQPNRKRKRTNYSVMTAEEEKLAREQSKKRRATLKCKREKIRRTTLNQLLEEIRIELGIPDGTIDQAKILSHALAYIRKNKLC